MNRHQINKELPIGNVHITKELYDPVTAILGVASLVGAGAAVKTSIDAKKQAKKDAAAQAKLVAEQEKKIAEEEKRQQTVADERKKRLASRELLTGSETGISTPQDASLLAGSQ